MMRTLVLILLGATLYGCAGKTERLAKCSADENPVPALSFTAKPSPGPHEHALAQVIADDCGPMRPVNQFQGVQSVSG